MGKLFTVGCPFHQSEEPSSLPLPFWPILCVFALSFDFSYDHTMHGVPLSPLDTIQKEYFPLDFVLSKAVLKQQHCDKNAINLLIAQKLQLGFLLL